MRSLVIVASVLVASSLAAQAQNSSNRLMFDPNGLGTESRKFTPQSATTTPAAPAPATAAATTGQSIQQQPAARQVAAPQPQGAPKQAAAPKIAPRTTASTPARRAPQAERPVNDTTASAPARSAADRPVPREQPNLGRLSLPQGTLGYESKTQMQTYDMSDGRRVPGYDNIQRNDSSYFGLSLKMPTFGSPSSSGSSSSSSSPSWSSSPSPFGLHGAN